jgi:uridylate kinase
MDDGEGDCLCFRRVLLKLSGEALAGRGGGFGLDPGMLAHVAREVASARAQGAEVAIVVGAGNFLRGASLQAAGFDRVQGDRMGMLATILNAMSLVGSFAKAGIPALALSALEVRDVVGPYTRERAAEALAAGQVVLLAGGTGNPFFSTDTAAALRAAELDADALVKATKVDGVYDRDPIEDPAATRFESLTYHEVLERGLGVMDLTAVTLCRENRIPIVVYDLYAEGALVGVLRGARALGTTVRG